MKSLSNKYLIVLLLTYLFSSYVLLCQNNKRTFQHFSSENGLTQNYVSCINQDNEGYILLSNYDGISRFDGHNFNLIKTSPKDSIENEYLQAETLFKDHLGRIWISNSNDLTCYDATKGKTVYYSKNKNFRKVIGGRDITSLAEDEFGIIWIGTRKGLFRFDEKKDEYSKFVHDTVGERLYVYYKNRIRELLYDNKGIIWVATVSGLFKFSIHSHQFIPVFKTADNPNTNLDDILSMTFDKTGNIWLAINGEGIRVIDTTTNKISYINTRTTNNQLNSNNIGKLLCDRMGNIWISHITKGINIYHPKTNEYDSYLHDESDSHSLSDDRTTTLFEDRDGMMWIGTQSEGVDGVSAILPKFNTFTQHSGLPNSLCEKGITCATEDQKGNLWIGSQNGLVFFDRKKNIFTCYHQEESNPNSLCNNNINGIKIDRKGILWIATNKGLNKFDPISGKWKWYFYDTKVPQSFPSEIANGLCERKNGELWIVTNGGPCRYNPEKDCFENRYSNSTIDKLIREYYNNIFEDSKNTIWVSTSRSGVYQLDGSFKVLNEYRFDKSKRNGIPSNSIIDFDEDKEGNIWMASRDGVCKLNVKTQQFKSYKNSDGIPSNLITQLKIADDGAIWLGSCLGLTQMLFDTNGNPLIKNFSISDGLQSNVFSTSASLKLNSGELFFGGSKGFNLFLPSSIEKNTIVPAIKVSVFSVFDKEFDYFSSYDSLKKIMLDYKQNFFSFDMAALNFDHSEKNQYAYQLEGFDKEMVYCGTRYHVSYTNVPPGEYSLHIIGSNNDGIWNNEGIRIKIEITPPFWKTWWFISITSILIIISFTLLIQFLSTRRFKKRLANLKQQQEIERIRSRISRDIHDEIGSGLTRISLLSELVKSNSDKKNKDIPLLEKIISSSREISNSLSEIIWTVNPEHDNIDSMLSYMRGYINKFFDDANVSYSVHFPENIISNYIHPDIKRNLFLILKESLNNIIKHSLAKNVSITFQLTEDIYQFIVNDDGIGMEESKKNEFGNGLRNIHARSESIHAISTIESSYNKGTRIIIEGKLYDK